jgi:hypothetical protein
VSRLLRRGWFVGGAAGTQSLEYPGLPAGSVCTVTETQSGALATVLVTTEGSPQTVTIAPDGTGQADLADTDDFAPRGRSPSTRRSPVRRPASRTQ